VYTGRRGDLREDPVSERLFDLEARFRLQVMADRTHDELALAAEIMAAAVRRANDRLDLICTQEQRAVA
jgi:hypothetical protein